jgi:hypothetical protein
VRIHQKSAYMKSLIFLLILLLSSPGFSQTLSEEESAKKLVIDFFEAFHQQDSIKLKSFAHKDVVLQSISVSEAEEAKLTTYSYSELVDRIVSIPETTKFEEILHDFEVSVQGKLASVSTPFSFYLNGEFSHCGVNSFQLMKVEEEWKIIYLVDTRQKTGCQEN